MSQQVCGRYLRARPAYRRRLLLARDLELVVGEDEVLLVLRLVAAEAAVEIGGRVRGLVGPEDLVFPIAVALLLRIFAAPSGALLHDPVAGDVARLDEAAVGVLDRIALRVELRREGYRRDPRSARERHSLFCGIDRFPVVVIPGDLLFPDPIEAHVD